MEKYIPLLKLVGYIIAAIMPYIQKLISILYEDSSFCVVILNFIVEVLSEYNKIYSLWSSECSHMAKQIHSNASLCVPTNEAYRPFWASSSKWVPSSIIFPSEQNAIWWAFWTVLNRCAITSVVLPFIRRFRASWTSRSLTASSALVAYTKKTSIVIRD